MVWYLVKHTENFYLRGLMFSSNLHNNQDVLQRNFTFYITLCLCENSILACMCVCVCVTIRNPSKSIHIPRVLYSAPLKKLVY